MSYPYPTRLHHLSDRLRKMLVCTRMIEHKTVVPSGIWCCHQVRYFCSEPEVKPRRTTMQRSASAQKHANQAMKKVFLFSLAATGLAIGYAYFLFGRRKRNQVPLEERIVPVFDNDVDPQKAKMVSYRGFVLPSFVQQRQLYAIKHFNTRDDDVFVVSFPKSGTTWVQEIVYLVNTNLDFTAASKHNMEDRFPYFEFIYPGLAAIESQAGPRLIKSHMPLSLLPEDILGGKGKVIYIARNPKDVSVSYYHYIRMLKEVSYKGDLQTFSNKFFHGRVAYGPWERHVGEFWRMRHLENVLFITYEDLHKDTKGVIRKIADFLGKQLSDDQIARIARHCSFSQMKKNPTSNYSWWDDLGIRNKNECQFFRKGKVGDWKNHLDATSSQHLEVLCQETLETLGLHFEYELGE